MAALNCNIGACLVLSTKGSIKVFNYGFNVSVVDDHDVLAFLTHSLTPTAEKVFIINLLFSIYLFIYYHLLSVVFYLIIYLFT